MPFDFENPKGLQEPNRKLKFNAYTIETRWPTDRYDTTGGTFLSRVDKDNRCPERCPGKFYDFSRYSNNYLRTHIMFQNPSTLCGLKNTKIMGRVLHPPPIEVTSPKFSHRPNRSISHLRLPTKYRTALCTITENLNEQNRKFRKQKADQLAAEQVQVHMDAFEEFASRFNISSGSDASFLENKSAKPKDALTESCKRGKMFECIKKRVEQDVYNQEMEELNKKAYFFPPASKIAFDIDDKNDRKKPGSFLTDRYEYDPEGGMGMMCSKGNSRSKFYETSSEKKLVRTYLKDETDSLNANSKQFSAMVLKRQKYNNPLAELNTGVPNELQKLNKKRQESSAHASYSHYHLLEQAKKEAVKQVVYALKRREPKVILPNALITSAYGPMKYPQSTIIIPPLPEHLMPNQPPTEQELEVVEADILHDVKARKLRREKGIKADSDSISQRLTKPLFVSDDERSEISLKRKISQEKKVISQEQEILDDMCQEFKFFEQCIIPPYKKPGDNNFHQSTIDELLPLKVSVVAQDGLLFGDNKTGFEMQPTTFCDKLQETKENAMRENTNPLKMTSSVLSQLLSSSSSEEGDIEMGQSEISLKQFSSTNFQYSDIAFSDIDDQINDVPTIQQNPMYRTLATENESETTEESLLDVTINSDIEEMTNDNPSEFNEDEQADEQANNFASETVDILEKMFKDVQPHLARNVEKKISVAKHLDEIPTENAEDNIIEVPH